MQLVKVRYDIVRTLRKYCDQIEYDENTFENLLKILNYLSDSRKIQQHYNFLYKIIYFCLECRCDKSAAVADEVMILTCDLIGRATKRRKIQLAHAKQYYGVVKKWMRLHRRKWAIDYCNAPVNCDVVLAFGAMYRQLTKKMVFQSMLQKTRYIYDMLDMLQYLNDINIKFWLSLLIEILDWPYPEPYLYIITWSNKTHKHIKSLLIRLYVKFQGDTEIKFKIYILYKILFKLAYHVRDQATFKNLKYNFINLELDFNEKLFEIELTNFYNWYKQAILECNTAGVANVDRSIERAKEMLRQERESLECKRLNQVYGKLRATRVQRNLEARLVNAKYHSYTCDNSKCAKIIDENRKMLLDKILVADNLIGGLDRTVS